MGSAICSATNFTPIILLIMREHRAFKTKYESGSLETIASSSPYY